MSENNRREFIKKSALISVGALVGCKVVSETTGTSTGTTAGTIPVIGGFSLTPLPYDFEALEPHIDKMTMQIHHGKHHQAYVDNLNKALTELKSTADNLEEICKNISSFNTAVRNNAGGHYNHSLFWNLMSPKGGGEPTGKILEVINSNFTSFEEFKKKFNEAGTKRFGSGWAWLVKKSDGTFEITSTPNQDNPLMDVVEVKGTPIMGIDVWEHAYYLKYQNKRPDYLAAIWNVINWNAVAERYAAAMK
jgi:Fe-Mn family superoxide dismutase